MLISNVFFLSPRVSVSSDWARECLGFLPLLHTIKKLAGSGTNSNNVQRAQSLRVLHSLDGSSGKHLSSQPAPYCQNNTAKINELKARLGMSSCSAAVPLWAALTRPPDHTVPSGLCALTEHRFHFISFTSCLPQQHAEKHLVGKTIMMFDTSWELPYAMGNYRPFLWVSEHSKMAGRERGILAYGFIHCLHDEKLELEHLLNPRLSRTTLLGCQGSYSCMSLGRNSSAKQKLS